MGPSPEIEPSGCHSSVSAAADTWSEGTLGWAGVGRCGRRVRTLSAPGGVDVEGGGGGVM